jgi:phenylalanyl-tRNA synthetase beta chain
VKISYNWLKNYIKLNHTPEQLSETLTNTGLEVEGISSFSSVKGGLNGLVVGLVAEKEKHPNADKLSLTKVDVGTGELLSIVCGAPNVAKGQKVIVATVGTTLYPTHGEPFTITKSKIRGEVSEGMICAEDEIGIGTSHDGIMILDEKWTIGTPAAEVFEVENDFVFEIGLTPNRTDAMCHLGVARDIAAALNAHSSSPVSSKLPEFTFPAKSAELPVSVTIENTEACPRYSGVVISDIEIKPSSAWLQNKLKAVGVRPINNVVDITNFVLKEMGQPLHAFDYNTVAGNKVIVKTLPENTEFVTLDSQTKKLSATDLMICNEKEGMCIAGVFGGEKSGVTQATTSIFLESAYFNSTFIRKTSTRLGLRTDAATRYEKGADPNITILALKRAAQLICDLAGGKIASEIIDIYPQKIADFSVELRIARLESLGGVAIPTNTVKQILQDLEIKVLKEENDVLSLQVPAFKTDVQREVDVIEEVLRIYGFNNISTPNTVQSTLVFTQGVNKHQLKEQISAWLNGMGYSEIMTNSISKSALYSPEQATSLVKLQNSMTSELDVMRASLLPDGLEVLTHNINRKNANLKFYEFGNVYAQDYSQSEKIAFYLTGETQIGNWKKKAEKSDLFYLKGVVDALLKKLHFTDFNQTESQRADFDYGIDYVVNDKTPVQIGCLSKVSLNKFDIEQPVFYAELDFDYLLKKYGRAKTRFTEIPKFPSVNRDLALIVDESVSFEKLKKKVEIAGGKLLKKTDLFDIYKDEAKIGAGKKSYALSFTLLDDKKTLTDNEIDKIITKILRTLEQEFQATIRK